MDNIPFPFEPYPQQDTQAQLMSRVVEAICKGHIGIFESPTGTGKSLSIICSALHWQQIEENRMLREIEEQMATSSKSSSVDWLQEMIAAGSGDSGSVKTRALESMRQLRGRISAVANAPPAAHVRSHVPGKYHRDASLTQGSSTGLDTVKMQEDGGAADEEEFSLKNYDSDESSPMEAAAHSEDEQDDGRGDIADLGLPKIYYCSRTHSQVAQFVSEIRKTAFSSVRCVSLGSRRNMCINTDVNKLTSDAAVSEKCLDMQRRRDKTHLEKISSADGKKRARVSRKTSSKCSYHCSSRENHFMEHALGRVRDIEELVTLGGQLTACPYYGSRRAIAAAQVICLPYTMMLQQSQRQALGISLKGNVVIFDEAHNVVDATNSTHSAVLYTSQILKAQEAVKIYLERFRAVLTGKNLYYLNLLTSVLQSLKKYLLKRAKALKTKQEEPGSEPSSPLNDGLEVAVSDVNTFVFDSALDNINLWKLQKHSSETQLVQKVSGFAENKHRRDHLANLDSTEGTVGVTGEATKVSRSAEPMPVSAVGYQAALRAVFALVGCLCNRESDGRLFIGPRGSLDRLYTDDVASPQESALAEWAVSFVLMNPSNHFRAIVDEARSIIFVGGTLQPFSHISSQLFPHAPLAASVPNSATTLSACDDDQAASENPKSVITFSCSHIVPPSHVWACAISSGINNTPFDFRHAGRHNVSLIEDLGSSLSSLMQCVPYGMVVFFTSYSYMEYVVAEWAKRYVLHRLRAAKPVYVETRTKGGVSGGTESVWTQYSAAATASVRGACLFSVMGGKLSEGINFSDNLARCVVVVGMPYPDTKDVILQQKMKYAENSQAGGGRNLYEAMCMKSVNQSIGRSIRHANDYACVVLLDGRYCQQRITTQLPTWISRRLMTYAALAPAVTDMRNFFDTLRSSQL